MLCSHCHNPFTSGAIDTPTARYCSLRCANEDAKLGELYLAIDAVARRATDEVLKNHDAHPDRTLALVRDMLREFAVLAVFGPRPPKE